MSPFPFLMGMTRKPKRVRTAFNPSQLLQLEQAFEKNQYVVGQERKQLANSLQLSETQVRQKNCQMFAALQKNSLQLFDCFGISTVSVLLT